MKKENAMGFRGTDIYTPEEKRRMLVKDIRKHPLHYVLGCLSWILVVVVIWSVIASAVFWMRHPETKTGDVNWINVMTFGYTEDEQ